ncbi:PDZ domain-containing protein [Spirosoma sp. HMF4905]|uniref:PDZ domain-containing protein n=1 Tax=Spirosoma arboris TaxID=2682092 RepID=A0A7K1SI01_9BACT|nr:PDZ domain-containing protein [Spirosoma arboris]MVM33449.1 PDZ domain-containing protein [Spirosoma arboris]
MNPKRMQVATQWSSVYVWLLTFFLLLNNIVAKAQTSASNWHFDVAMAQPATHMYHVTFRCPTGNVPTLTLKMPAWTPGYYQMMNYAANVDNVRVTDESEKALAWKKTGNSTWVVQTGSAKQLVFTYDVKATRNFVASPYLDENKGYISPAGLFVHVVNQLKQPVTITLHPSTEWPDLIATGLDSIPGQRHTFTAPDFDVLYDSPILMGKLEQLPAFTVGGVPHYFVGYNMGDFDRQQFIADLKKIVESSVAVIGDIPYKHYTFLAIGPGGGGIEHLNSTSISFSGAGLDKPAGRLRMYSFLTHEYFHHYNVKRIRPIALGPFDYEHENRTNMLWVSEGLTVYYEYLILRRAELMSQDDVLNTWQSMMTSFENKPGRLHQSATQASYETWEDGPFGRTGDDAYKSISYYEKGAILGVLLDLTIRHATQNKKSLDDVMRTLYQTYYRTQNRGFTDDEFRSVCEKTAGTSLAKVFEYTSTVKPIDYANYLAYAGLNLTDNVQAQPGGWLGVATRAKGDSVFVTSVDWESPAWKAGVRTGDQLLLIDDQVATVAAIQALSQTKVAGDTVTLQLLQQGQPDTKSIQLGTKKVRQLKLTRQSAPTALQSAILADWLRGTHASLKPKH